MSVRRKGWPASVRKFYEIDIVFDNGTVTTKKMLFRSKDEAMRVARETGERCIIRHTTWTTGRQENERTVRTEND